MIRIGWQISRQTRATFATHSNPVCSVVEYDSPMGPDGQIPRVELVYQEQTPDE